MSHEQVIIRSRDFDPSKLEFGDVKTMKDVGAQFVPIQYEGKNLFVQTPEMLVPFGMNKYTPKDKNGEPTKESTDGSWSLDLSFFGEDQNEELKAFHEKLDKVESVLADVAYERAWVKDKKEKDPKKRNKSVSKDVLNKLIGQQVKYSTSPKAVDEKGNHKYPPTMRVKVQFDGKSFYSTEAYDENKEPIQEPLNDVIKKGCRVKCLIQCSAVYLGQTITLSWRLTQVKIRQTSRVSGYSFVEDGEDNEDNSEDNRKNSKPAPKQSSKPAMVDDSDDDNDNTANDDADDDKNSDDKGSDDGSGNDSDEEPVVIPKKTAGKGRK